MNTEKGKEEKVGRKSFVLEIVIGGNGIIMPSQIPQLLSRLPEAGGMEGVVISGRLPVWAYAAIAHHFHARPFVATFEPRMGKGVVVQSHVSDLNVGDLVDVPEEKVVITFS
jgi:CRISPR-associated protein Csx3